MSFGLGDTMKRRFFFIILIGLSLPAAAEPDRLEIRKGRLFALLSELSLQLEPSLPAPALLPEPEYTLGSANTVYWSLDSVASILAGLPEPRALVAFDVEASFGETRLWAPVNADEDSVTFTYLPEGVVIRYKIRYFARNASGGYEMSHWSDEEFSIQDMSPPVLYPVSNIGGLQPGGRLSWVNDRVLQLHVIA